MVKRQPKPKKTPPPQRIEHQPVEPSNWKDDKLRVDATMMSSQHHPGWFPIPPQKNAWWKSAGWKETPRQGQEGGGKNLNTLRAV